MGTLTLNKIDRLYWLGRYAERVNTTLRFLMNYYDQLIDSTPMPHAEVCRRLAIDDIYSSDEDFAYRFAFEEDNPDSLAAAAERMLGNGMTLRETISTQTLSYLQLALNSLNEASMSSAPLIEAQQVIDYIMAFRGSFDDNVEDESIRNLIKLGFNIEKLSLYLRFDEPEEICLKEAGKLLARIRKTDIRTRSGSLAVLLSVTDPQGNAAFDRASLIDAVENLIEF